MELNKNRILCFELSSSGSFYRYTCKAADFERQTQTNRAHRHMHPHDHHLSYQYGFFATILYLLRQSRQERARTSRASIPGSQCLLVYRNKLFLPGSLAFCLVLYGPIIPPCADVERFTRRQK